MGGIHENYYDNNSYQKSLLQQVSRMPNSSTHKNHTKQKGKILKAWGPDP